MILSIMSIEKAKLSLPFEGAYQYPALTYASLIKIRELPFSIY